MTIHMYWMDTQKHQLPHFHARYRGNEAVFTLEGHLLEGNLGARARRLVEEWCAQRAVEIRQAWECAVAGQEIPWVLPLR